jgi:hypothetical protein
MVCWTSGTTTLKRVFSTAYVVLGQPSFVIRDICNPTNTCCTHATERSSAHGTSLVGIEGIQPLPGIHGHFYHRRSEFFTSSMPRSPARNSSRILFDIPILCCQSLQILDICRPCSWVAGISSQHDTRNVLELGHFRGVAGSIRMSSVYTYCTPKRFSLLATIIRHVF